MKTKFTIGAIVMGTIILTFQMNHSLKSQSVLNQVIGNTDAQVLSSDSMATVESISLHKIGSAQDDGLSGLPTVNSIMNQYRTFNEEDLRSEIVRISQIAESRNLYDKANSGRITQVEKRDLAQIIRIDTALHHLLIDRELENN